MKVLQHASKGLVTGSVDSETSSSHPAFFFLNYGEKYSNHDWNLVRSPYRKNPPAPPQRHKMVIVWCSYGGELGIQCWSPTPLVKSCINGNTDIKLLREHSRKQSIL